MPDEESELQTRRAEFRERWKALFTPRPKTINDFVAEHNGPARVSAALQREMRYLAKEYREYFELVEAVQAGLDDIERCKALKEQDAEEF